MSQDANNQVQLRQLSGEMDKALNGARISAILVTVLAVASIGLISFWLNKAHKQFMVDLSPEFGAEYATARITDALPTLTPELKKRAIDYAPQALDQAEAKLMAIPDEFADSLTKRADEELTKLAPVVEEELLKSLRVALGKAKDSRKPGETDEQQIKGLIDAMAATYAAESVKLIDELRSRYTAKGADVLAYLDYLAENKGLDKRESLQRQALVTFLTIASRARAEAGK